MVHSMQNPFFYKTKCHIILTVKNNHDLSKLLEIQKFLVSSYVML